jgi:hypothetical protein
MEIETREGGFGDGMLGESCLELDRGSDEGRTKGRVIEGWDLEREEVLGTSDLENGKFVSLKTTCRAI